MPKCPKCNEEIDYLNLFSRIEQRGRFELDPSGDPQFLVEGTVPDYDDDDFECPNCNEVLFHDSDEAEEFLKSSVELSILRFKIKKKGEVW
jgi:transcription initiation factor IIE alpha subunit